MCKRSESCRLVKRRARFGAKATVSCQLPCFHGYQPTSLGFSLGRELKNGDLNCFSLSRSTLAGGVHGEGLGKGQRGGSWWHLVREGVFGGHVGEGAGLWQLCLAPLTCPLPPGAVRPQPAGVQRVHRQPG